MSAQRIYLAGPEVFLPNMAEVQEAKKTLVREYGLVPVTPGDADAADFPTSHEKGMAISARDETLMDSSDAIIANLTPYRGIAADTGTCFELGYMSAQGKPAFAYSNEAKNHHDRVLEYYGGKVQRDAKGLPRGPDGLLVEDFDMIDNLMLQGGIERRGGAVVAGHAAADAMFSNLAAFTEIVKIAAAKLL